MKHLTLLSGSFGISLTLLGFLFEILHWKGASMMLLVGIAGLAILFVPSITFMIYRKYRLVPIVES
jgi:hypothetical protein